MEPCLQALVDRLGGQDPGVDRVVHALERHGVDHAAGVAHQHGAGHRELGHRPVAAARERLGAPGHALAALEDLLDQRVGLEGLQQVVGRRWWRRRTRGRSRSRSRPGRRRSPRPSSGRSRCRRPGRTWPPVCSGHGPMVWITRSSGLGTFQTSLTPSSQVWGSRSSPRSNSRMAGPVRWPQQPSASTVALALMSAPGSKLPELLALLAAALVAGAHAHHRAVLDDQLRGGGLGEDVGARRPRPRCCW